MSGFVLLIRPLALLFFFCHLFAGYTQIAFIDSSDKYVFFNELMFDDHVTDDRLTGSLKKWQLEKYVHPDLVPGLDYFGLRFQPEKDQHVYLTYEHELNRKRCIEIAISMIDFSTVTFKLEQLFSVVK